MEPIRLPRDSALFQEGGYWIVRWRGDLSGGIRHPSSENQARIASASGPEALVESDALRLAEAPLAGNDVFAWLISRYLAGSWQVRTGWSLLSGSRTRLSKRVRHQYSNQNCDIAVHDLFDCK